MIKQIFWESSREGEGKYFGQKISMFLWERLMVKTKMDLQFFRRIYINSLFRVYYSLNQRWIYKQKKYRPPLLLPTPFFIWKKLLFGGRFLILGRKSMIGISYRHPKLLFYNGKNLWSMSNIAQIFNKNFSSVFYSLTHCRKYGIEKNLKKNNIDFHTFYKQMT